MPRKSRVFRKLRCQRTPTLEQLEARLTFSIDALSDSLAGLLASDGLPVVSAPATLKNSAPVVVSPIRSNGATQITSDRTQLSVLGKDDQGESKLTYRWQLISAPKGATVSFSSNNSNAAKQTTAIFNKPGAYTLSVTMTDFGGLKTTTNTKLNVVQTLSQITLFDSRKTAVAAGAKLSTGGTSSSISLVGRDQFKNVMPLPTSLVWSATSTTAGAKATIQRSGDQFTVTYNKAGDYQLKVTSGKLSTAFSVSVVPTLTKISVTPGVESTQAGARQQFTARGLDQFQNPLVRQPKFVWTSTAGTVTTSGLWSAPTQSTTAKVQATSGTVSAAMSIRVTATNASSDFQTPALAGLIHSYYADGSISRPDMIQILRSAGIDGRVDTTELSDLRNLVSLSAKYKISDDVRVLASDVVNGNPANATYQGRALGNLSVGASAAQLNLLIDKWFYGTDRPTLTGAGLTYQVASGSLFGQSPSHLDQKQGALGDCYFISTLGIIASKSPNVIRDMFIDNRDGTFTVRFFSGVYGAFASSDGGFSDGFRTGTAKADYVTVDRWLPSQAGRFAYSNAGALLSSSSNSLWLALAEKAYAQWNATGKSGRSVAANTFSSIEGGWMSTVSAQVLGYNATNYALSSTPPQKLIDALKSGKAVTIGTRAGVQTGGLVGSHAYSITGYNPQTQLFQLHNPWGNNHPTGLSYSQLQTNCSYFVVADTSQFVVASRGFATPRVASLQTAAEGIVELRVEQFQTRGHQREVYQLQSEPTVVAVLQARVDTHVSSENSPNHTETRDVVRDVETTLELVDHLFGLLAEDDALFS